MMLTPADIFTRVDDELQDAGGVRWSQNDRLRYLNDGRREMAILRPDIYAQTMVLTLVAGTRQAVPANCTQLLDIQRNVGGDGTTPGAAIRIIEREIMDAFNPGWHQDAPQLAIRHFMFDERIPKIFWVYPPASGNRVEASVSVEPVDVGVSDPLAQEGIHAGLLMHYVIYRALMRDAVYASNAELAAQRYQLFASGLGVSAKRNFTTSPNTADQGGTPSRVAAAEGGG